MDDFDFFLDNMMMPQYPAYNSFMNTMQNAGSLFNDFDITGFNSPWSGAYNGYDLIDYDDIMTGYNMPFMSPVYPNNMNFAELPDPETFSNPYPLGSFGFNAPEPPAAPEPVLPPDPQAMQAEIERVKSSDRPFGPYFGKGFVIDAFGGVHMGANMSNVDILSGIPINPANNFNPLAVHAGSGTTGTNGTPYTSILEEDNRLHEAQNLAVGNYKSALESDDLYGAAKYAKEARKYEQDIRNLYNVPNYSFKDPKVEGIDY